MGPGDDNHGRETMPGGAVGISEMDAVHLAVERGRDGVRGPPGPPLACRFRADRHAEMAVGRLQAGSRAECRDMLVSSGTPPA